MGRSSRLFITESQGSVVVFSDASRKSLLHSHTNPPVFGLQCPEEKVSRKKIKIKLSWTGGFRDTLISFFVLPQ